MNIKVYREEQGLSQVRLAEIMGVKQPIVAQWESGVRVPRADKLPKLAAALGCTIDDLYRESLSTMDSQMIEHPGGREEGLR